MSRAADPAELHCPACGRASPPDARFCAGCGHRLGAGFDLSDDGHDGGADPLLGRIIADRYRIERLLGRGGMGVVYRVEHARIGKLMAMKLLHGRLARDKDVVKRFKREAEAASKLDHPNTVQVFDFGQSEGMMYLVMEYLSGRDLGEVIKAEGALPFERVARIAAQISGSVQQAHERGIVHRDLKPENVMVVEGAASRDFVKVLDFGLAKLRESEENAEKSITRAGSILGTPYYMAPEHIRGESVDARSDIYALGALIYKAITGVPPFWAASPVGILTMHLTEEVVPPSERAPELAIPPDADRIVLKAMAKSARDRYQSMEQLRGELLAYLAAVGADEGLESGRVLGGVVPTDSGRPREIATRSDVDDYERRLRRSRFASYALLALLALGAAGAGGWAWMQRTPPAARTESEPNDTITDADVLPVDTTLRAFLGKRLDEQRSDADFYVLSSPDGARRTVRIEVSAIPNMDIVVEVFREGISTPLLTADGGPMGYAEIVPNFVIEGPRHYLRVRELWDTGRWPTENVSDPYEVRWSFVEPEPDDEREVNDSLELAERVRVGTVRRGFVGWGGDHDSFCLEAPASDVVARLDGIPTLDLVLQVVDRGSGRAWIVDEGRLGEGEVSEPIARATRDTCFVVSARRPKDGPGSDPDERYALRIEGAEPAREAGAAP